MELSSKMLLQKAKIYSRNNEKWPIIKIDNKLYLFSSDRTIHPHRATSYFNVLVWDTISTPCSIEEALEIILKMFGEFPELDK